MMQFTPTEMATIYRQAADKRKQIQAFMELNGQTEEEVKASLMGGGILGQQFPRERRLHNQKVQKMREIRRNQRLERNSRRRPQNRTPQNRTRGRPGSPAA